MALDTYEGLLAKIERISDRSDLAADMPDCVTLAEAFLTRELGLRVSDAEVTGATVGGQDYVNLPARALDPRYLRFDVAPVSTVRIVSMDEFTEYSRMQAERPMVGTHQGLKLMLAPTPQSAIAYTLFYRKRQLALEADAPGNTNWLLVEAPDLYLYASLYELKPLLGGDPRCEEWRALRDEKIPGIMAQEQRAKLGGGKLRVKPTVFPA